MNIGDKITIQLPFDNKPQKVVYMGVSHLAPCRLHQSPYEKDEERP